MNDYSDEASLTVDALKEAVGSDVYARACRVARALAPGTGTRLGREQTIGIDYGSLRVVLDEVDRRTWRSASNPSIVGFYLELYRDLPAYSLLTDLFFILSYERFSPSQKDEFWSVTLDALSGEDDAQADPLSYLLWCDFFEDPKLVAEAWGRVLSRGDHEKLLGRLLAASGPVPWALKRPLYARLARKERFHEPLFKGIRASRYDVFGKIDRALALRLLDGLKLGKPYTDELRSLKRALK